MFHGRPASRIGERPRAPLAIAAVVWLAAAYNVVLVLVNETPSTGQLTVVAVLCLVAGFYGGWLINPPARR